MNLLRTGLAMAALLLPAGSLRAEETPDPAAPPHGSPTPSSEFVMFNAEYKQSYRLYLDRQFDKAIEVLDRAESKYPATAESVNLRAAIHIENREFDKARELLAKSAKLDPTSAIPEFNLAEIDLLRGDYNKAEEAFLKLSDKLKGHELVSLKLVIVALRQGNDERAMRRLKDLEKIGSVPTVLAAAAAWEFAHGNRLGGVSLIEKAQHSSDGTLSPPVYDSLADQGWVPRRVPQTQER